MTDNISFEAIYESHKKMVYNLALHYVQNIEQAQDITQEVFVKVYQHLPKYDPGSASLKTWISRITLNHCLDQLRAKKTKRRFAFITNLFQQNSNTPLVELAVWNHPGVAAEDKEQLQKLFKLINELPEKQKTVLILCKIDDRPQQEVAEIMGMHLKAIESLLQRAKQNLEKKISAGEGF